MVTVIYMERRGSCLNCKANKVSSKQAKFRPRAGNNIIRAKACYITPSASKTRYASVLAKAAAGFHVRLKYPFHFIKT